MESTAIKIINPFVDREKLTSLASIWNSTTIRLLLYVHICLF